MSERLTDFIKHNRDSFDNLEPNEAIWPKIEKDLGLYGYGQTLQKKSFSLGFVLRVAALVIIVMGIGFVCYLQSEKTHIDLVKINPGYAKQQAHFASLVESKRSELKSVTKADPQLYQEFSNEFLHMDSVYKKLRSELPGSPNREKVLRAMIRNLEMQTEVLNQQLGIVEQYNRMKTAKNDEVKNI